MFVCRLPSAITVFHVFVELQTIPMLLFLNRPAISGGNHQPLREDE